MEVAAVGAGMASLLLQGPMAPLRVEVAATDRPTAYMGLHLQVNVVDLNVQQGAAMPLPALANSHERQSRSCCSTISDMVAAY